MTVAQQYVSRYFKMLSNMNDFNSNLNMVNQIYIQLRFSGIEKETDPF